MDYWARVLVYGVSLAVSKIVAFSVVVGVRYTELRNVSLGPCASGGRLNLFGDLPGFCARALVLLASYLQSILGEVSCSSISFPALFHLCARSWTAL